MAGLYTCYANAGEPVFIDGIKTDGLQPRNPRGVYLTLPFGNARFNELSDFCVLGGRIQTARLTVKFSCGSVAPIVIACPPQPSDAWHHRLRLDASPLRLR